MSDILSPKETKQLLQETFEAFLEKIAKNELFSYSEEVEYDMRVNEDESYSYQAIQRKAILRLFDPNQQLVTIQITTELKPGEPINDNKEEDL